ncbi:MAG: DUF349 domain-containing protein [Flavobacteriales bacterium]
MSENIENKNEESSNSINQENQLQENSKVEKIQEKIELKTDSIENSSLEINSVEITETTDGGEHEVENEKQETLEVNNINFDDLSKEELITQLDKIIKNNPIHKIKDVVEELKHVFYTKINKDLEQSKEEFLSEGGNIIDFHYSTPLKKKFNTIYFDYKDKRNNFYKNRAKDLNKNLEKRLELLEELKNLFNKKGSTGTIYKHFRSIQEQWFDAGDIPRDKNNIVWNNYHYHVENFYNILHLDRAFRDRNFKQNLELKLGLISRAEELTQEDDIIKAFRELQMLHKIWKEEIGPVSKEYSEDIWNKFSAATKVIHDKRHEYEKELEKEFKANFEIKKQLIDQIITITNKENKTHKEWQNAIKEVQELRDSFFNIGRVSRSKNNEIWSLFKDATSNFNKEKNNFYKNQKKEQYTNLDKKLELIKIAEENKDGEDFEVLTSLFKKIQNDWKKIGHVPKKESDKIWKKFKETCNYYFDRLHAQQNEANKEELENLKAKQEIIDSISKLKLAGEHKENLESIHKIIADWKAIGKVPYNKRNINNEFNNALNQLFNQLNIDKKEIELIKFENKLNTLVSQEDDRKLKNEEFFLGKKVEETKNEIRQLQNNLLFFKHVNDDNPLVKDVHKNIKKQQEQLDVWVSKLKKIRALRKE